MARPRHGDFVAIVCIRGGGGWGGVGWGGGGGGWGGGGGAGVVLKLKYETIMSAAKLDQRIPVAAMKVMFCEYRTGTI